MIPDQELLSIAQFIVISIIYGKSKVRQQAQISHYSIISTGKDMLNFRIIFNDFSISHLLIRFVVIIWHPVYYL